MFNKKWYVFQKTFTFQNEKEYKPNVLRIRSSGTLITKTGFNSGISLTTLITACYRLYEALTYRYYMAFNLQSLFI